MKPWILSCSNPDCRKMGCSTSEPGQTRPTAPGKNR